MTSLSRPIERAKPLLGTVVRIRVHGLSDARAHEAIDGAFEIVADIHRLMSFHQRESELSYLNREAWRSPVSVSPHTEAVLRKALAIAESSNGLFDPTASAAPHVLANLLSAPTLQPPDPGASWKDICLSADGSVVFGRPLWIDLGGIAKGYAVDCAFDYIQQYGPQRLCIDAGGDLRLSGPDQERVYLAAPSREKTLPVLEVSDAAVASSGSQPQSGDASNELVCPHIDPRTGAPCRTDRFVTVIAAQCCDADALTKVVMIAGRAAAHVLARYRAKAFLFDGASWVSIPALA